MDWNELSTVIIKLIQRKVFLEQHVKLASKHAALPSVVALEIGLSRKTLIEGLILESTTFYLVLSFYFTGLYTLWSWSRLGVSLADFDYNNCSSWPVSHMALHLFLNHIFIAFWCSLDIRQDLSRIPPSDRSFMKSTCDRSCWSLIQCANHNNFKIPCNYNQYGNLTTFKVVYCQADLPAWHWWSRDGQNQQCYLLFNRFVVNVSQNCQSQTWGENHICVFWCILKYTFASKILCIMQEMHCISTICVQHHLHLSLSSQSFKWSSSSTVLHKSASSSHFYASANLRLKCYITTLVPVTDTVQQRREKGEQIMIKKILFGRASQTMHILKVFTGSRVFLEVWTSVMSSINSRCRMY